jgi:molybdopterin synthase catalytic subunit
MPINIHVKFFASCRELVGESSVTVSLPVVEGEGTSEGTSTVELLRVLEDMFPSLKGGLSEVSLAVNKQYVDGCSVLREGDEVALLPPMSGG